MATGMFDYGRNEFANGNIDWVNDTIKAILIDETDDDPNLSADQNLDDIAGAARVATESLAGQSTPDTDGACDANDTTFSSVTGDAADGVLLYKHTGTESTSTLICYIDTGSGLPVTPNGGDITVQWQASTPYIFKL